MEVVVDTANKVSKREESEVEEDNQRKLKITNDRFVSHACSKLGLEPNEFYSHVVSPLMNLRKEDLKTILAKSIDINRNSSVRITNEASNVVRSRNDLSNSSFYLMMGAVHELANHVVDKIMGNEKLSEDDNARVILFVSILPFYVECLRQWDSTSNVAPNDMENVMRGWNSIKN